MTLHIAVIAIIAHIKVFSVKGERLLLQNRGLRHPRWAAGTSMP